MFVYSIAPLTAQRTVYGQALVMRGISAFDELNQSFRDIDILSDPTAGQVTIGCPEAIASGLLGAVLVRFCAQFPRVVVNVEEANNLAHEYQMLRERKVDLLLGSITRPFVEEDLDAQVVYEDRPYITAGATNRLALRRRVEVAELLEQQWVLPGESILRSVLEEALQAKGFALPKIGVKSYSVHQRISLLATGRFVSADSRSVLRYNGAASSVILLPVDLPIRSWPVAIVTLKGRTINPVVQTFIDCVRDVSKPLAIQNWVLQLRKARWWSTHLANHNGPMTERSAWQKNWAPGRRGRSWIGALNLGDIEPCESLCCPCSSRRYPATAPRFPAGLFLRQGNHDTLVE